MRILNKDCTMFIDGDVVYMLKKHAFEDKIRLVAAHISNFSNGITIGEFESLSKGNEALIKLANSTELVNL